MATQKEMNKRILTAARSGDVDTLYDCINKREDVNCQDCSDQTPLHLAARFGQTEVVEVLLNEGASVSAQDKEDQTPLHLAAMFGHTEVVELLLNEGASVSAQDKEDQTPLHLAGMFGHTEVVEFLLNEGASVFAQDDEDQTPLHLAARFGHTGVVELLLKEGATVSAQDYEYQTPLHLAAMFGHTGIVELLLNEGAIVSAEDDKGNTPYDLAPRDMKELLQGLTPLHRAVKEGSIEVIDLLVKAGASLSTEDYKGLTLLHTATKEGRTEVMEYLIKAGASLSAGDNEGLTPLHRAAEEGSIEVMDLLVKAGASLSAKDDEGLTPLHRAAEEGSIEVMDLLVKAGASLSAKDDEGLTALHTAAKESSIEVMDLLVKAGASLSAEDYDGCTPLHTAAGNYNSKVVEFLLKAGASLSVVDNQGVTPLQTAVAEGTTKVVDLLLKAGASLSVVDNQGCTPLHKAAGNDNTEIVEFLLKAGASLTVEDNQGKTPHDVACDNVKKILQEYAASRADSVFQFPMMGTVEEMKELISKGMFMAYDNRVYLAGACSVGKSTLASILLGEEFPLICKSTDGLIIYFGKNGIDLKNKKMVPLRKGFDGDVLAKVLRGQPDLKQEKHPSKYGESEPKRRKIMRSPPATKKKMTSEKHPAAESKAILSEKTDQALVKGASKEYTRKGLSKAQPQAQKMSKQSYITIHEDIKEELRKGNYKVNIAPSDLVDFGGQKSFDMTHQLFIQHKGEYILMFDGRFDLCDPLPEYPQGDVTTESILKHWISSILSYCADDDDILPIILFAATHSDFYSQKDLIDRRKRLTKDLTEMFQNHEQHKRIIYDNIFFINGKDENDPEIDRLKTKLVEIAFKQNSWGKRMPMAWVPLDLQFSEMRSHNTTLISIKDLTALNRSNQDFALTDTQIEHFLKAQHSLGKILYFDQHGLEKFIIVQPQSLVNILRSFITDEHFWPQDKSLRDILHTMINTGEIAKKDLLLLWSQEKFHHHMPNNEFKEFIIQVLVHLDILVEPKRYSQKQKYIVQSYLVPCIVKRKLPVTDVYYKSVEDKMICLSYKLLKSSIPAALSFKLIGAAMNVWPLKETSEGVCLYHQAAILCIDGSNELHISVKDNKIIIYLINKNTKHFISPSIASIVQECLTLTLKKVLEFYHKSFGKSLSTSAVSTLFEIEIGEWCDTGACYISVSEVKPMMEWTCNNKKIHKCPLVWIFDNTQDMCDKRCEGLGTEDLRMCPTDQHLVRLAGLVQFDTFYELVIHLGLSDVSWNNILEKYRGYDLKVMNFVALCEWRQQKYKEMEMTSFKDLSDALTTINHHRHVLCQIVINSACFSMGTPTFSDKVMITMIYLWGIVAQMFTLSDKYDMAGIQGKRQGFGYVKSLINESRIVGLGIDDIELQRIPDDDVLKELSEQVGNCAIQLGVELGLSMMEIEQTLFKYSKDIFSQTFDVLKKWKYARKVKPTIRILMRAIQSSDPRGLMFLRQKYVKFS